MVRKKCKKRCPNPNPDPSAGQADPQGSGLLSTSKAADRLNIYSFPLGVWRVNEQFNSTNDKIGIYVGNYSVASIFRNAGLTVNAPISTSQFKQIGPPSIGSLSIVSRAATLGSVDASDRFLYNASTGELFFDRDGSGVVAAVLIATLEDRPKLSASNIFAFDNFSTAPGNNNLLGGARNDSFAGANNQDILEGQGGNDSLSGIGGNDTLLGGTGDDTLNGGAGNDRLFGDGDGNVRNINFNGVGTLLDESFSDSTAIPGKDRLDGGDGNDSLLGGFGNSILLGGDGNDQLLALRGRDLLDGGTGDDRLRGGAGIDTLLGGEGRDRLVGGSGSDSLNGGADADLFILERNGGTDVIQDYDDTEDYLGLPQNPKFPSQAIRFQDLTITQQGRDALIKLGTQKLAVLKEVRANQLQAADFISLTDFTSQIKGPTLGFG